MHVNALSLVISQSYHSVKLIWVWRLQLFWPRQNYDRNSDSSYFSKSFSSHSDSSPISYLNFWFAPLQNAISLLSCCGSSLKATSTCLDNLAFISYKPYFSRVMILIKWYFPTSWNWRGVISFVRDRLNNLSSNSSRPWP